MAGWRVSAYLIFLLSVLVTHAADTNTVIDHWLAAQANLKTWTADATQTRTLKTLAQPLVAKGRVWFTAPDRFRWELGQPAQTIAVRRGDEMWISYPRIKRAEHYDLGAGKTGQWRDALGLLEAGFPQNRQQIDKQFKIASLTGTNDVWTLAMKPKSELAQKFISEVGVTLGTNSFALLGTDLTFADGSRMRNDFSNAVLNPTIDDSLFSPPMDSTYKVTEPLKE
jgi:outer membrane lipoprotein-sorting protein